MTTVSTSRPTPRWREYLAGARSIARPRCASGYLQGMSHVLRFEDLIQLDFAEQIFFEHKFVDAAVGDEGFLGDGDPPFVTKHWDRACQVDLYDLARLLV